MRIYTYAGRQTSRPSLNTHSAKHRASFARQATIGEVATAVVNNVGNQALRHGLHETGRADTDEKREAALEIAAGIVQLMGLDVDLIARGSA